MRIINSGKVTEDIYLLSNAILPAFLITGEKNILIDSGMTISAPFILEDMKSIPGINQEIHINLLTHSHFDHCGGTPFINRKYPEMLIGASPLVNDVMKKKNAVELIYTLNREAERDANIKSIFPDADISFTPFTVKLPLRENDVIKAGKGIEINVIETPGHTRDSISYYITPHRALFFGEAGGVPDADGYIFPQFTSNYEQYINSLKKLSSYEVDFLFLAHGGVLTGEDLKGYFKRAIDESIRFRERIISLLYENNMDIESVAMQIVKQDYNPEKITQAKKPYELNMIAMVRAIAKNIELNLHNL